MARVVSTSFTDERHECGRTKSARNAWHTTLCHSTPNCPAELTGTPRGPQGNLPVAPLIADKRCYGEVPLRFRWGSGSMSEREGTKLCRLTRKQARGPRSLIARHTASHRPAGWRQWFQRTGYRLYRRSRSGSSLHPTRARWLARRRIGTNGSRRIAGDGGR